MSSQVITPILYLTFFGLLAVTVQGHETDGLEVLPTPLEDNLISYKGTERESFLIWTTALDEFFFLKKYRTPGSIPGHGQNIYQCDYDTSPPPGGVCDFDIRLIGPCVQENYYNFHRSSPCIFFKLNEVVGWMPEFYNNTSQLPAKMPRDLKEHIEYLQNLNSIKLNTIWFSCEGKNPADAENIGPIQYFPRRGFPGYYFPYENDEEYLSPLVAVHFERPTLGVAINVECKFWANNIKHDPSNDVGSVNFKLLIEK